MNSVALLPSLRMERRSTSPDSSATGPSSWQGSSRRARSCGSVPWGENGSIANGVAATNTDVYVTGGTSSLERQSDAILLKFSAAGTLQWNIAWGGDGFDNAHDVAVGTDGVYFSGETNSFNANDAFVAKVDFNGIALWARDWAALDGDGFPGLTSAFGMGTTADGGVVITGNASDIGTLKNIILVKYNSTGTLVWQKIGGPGFGGGLDVVEAADGTLFVTGSILADTKNPEVFGGFAFVAEFACGRPQEKGFDVGRLAQRQCERRGHCYRVPTAPLPSPGSSTLRLTYSTTSRTAVAMPMRRARRCSAQRPTRRVL